jgi:hypothetical protein
VRDRGGASVGEKIRFTSSILPKRARLTKSLDALLPFSICLGCRPASAATAFYWMIPIT